MDIKDKAIFIATRKPCYLKSKEQAVSKPEKIYKVTKVVSNGILLNEVDEDGSSKHGMEYEKFVDEIYLSHYMIHDLKKPVEVDKEVRNLTRMFFKDLKYSLDQHGIMEDTDELDKYILGNQPLFDDLVFDGGVARLASMRKKEPSSEFVDELVRDAVREDVPECYADEILHGADTDISHILHDIAEDLNKYLKSLKDIYRKG